MTEYMWILKQRVSHSELIEMSLINSYWLKTNIASEISMKLLMEDFESTQISFDDIYELLGGKFFFVILSCKKFLF